MIKHRTHRVAALSMAVFLMAGIVPADTYRFNDAVDTDWMNGENWQNQTAGIKGWEVPGGIPLPGADDTVRFNYGGASGTLANNAGTIDGLQIGVDEGGSLTLNTGALLTTDSGNWSGMGAGGASAGTLTINGGLLTVNNGDGWNMGWNTSAHTVSVIINGGEMRVTTAFKQVKATTTATVTLNGGLLDVNSMILSAGVIDIAGGTLIIRSGDVRSTVASWVAAGLMIAHSGTPGAVVEASLSNGWTVVTAGLLPTETVPDVTGQAYVTAEADIVAAGLSVGSTKLGFDLPGDPVPGTVHSQMPVGGTEVAAGSAVDLVIAAPDLPPPGADPQLGMFQLGGDQFGLYWPKGYGPYEPEATDDLTESGSWTTMSGAINIHSNAYSKIVASEDPSTFYRLYVAAVDNTTLSNKSMMGYQGWFSAHGDGTPVTDRWHHWADSRVGYPDIDVWGIDFYPDMSEYSVGERYEPGWTLNNGETAYLFSSAHPMSVDLHCKWMWEYGIDGVFLQRFLSEVQDSRFFSFRNTVTENMKAGCENHGRLYAIMYDLSGTTDATMLSKITSDWNYLVGTLDVTNSPSYARHNGKPVVTIWGIGFKNRGYTPATATAMINYFKAQGMTVMGGVPDGWRNLTGSSETDPAWAAVYRSLDIISPWSVGRPKNLAEVDAWRINYTEPDLAEATAAGADYMPVIFPGFSWYNIKIDEDPNVKLNATPRLGGEFYWRQAYNAVDAGCTMLYTAMFDEMDEGTAMLKMVPTTNGLPAGATMVPLDIDGISLPSDWYLQVGGEAARMLRGEIPLQSSLPISP